jgi:hypothetical protein
MARFTGITDIVQAEQMGGALESRGDIQPQEWLDILGRHAEVGPVAKHRPFDQILTQFLGDLHNGLLRLS